MRTQNELPQRSSHYITDLDNHILVENHGGGVVISASRDNVSVKRKEFFIRHLAAEGYIADQYEWFSGSAEGGFCAVKWSASTSSDERETVFLSLRKWFTRRNALYGGIFIVWLLLCVGAARSIPHGLGL